MKPRLEYGKVAPGASRAMYELEKYVHTSGLEEPLIELVKMRASQINGCAYCSTCTRRTPARMVRPSSGCTRSTPGGKRRSTPTASGPRWPGPRRSPWSPATHVPDDVYEAARQHFSEKELVDLTLAIVAINGWNRLAIAFRSVPGTYQPRQRAAS